MSDLLSRSPDERASIWVQIWPILQPVLAVTVGLVLGLIVMAFAGETHAFQYLLEGAFGSWTNFGMSLFYSIPLVFTGLSVALAFQAGLFNIGAQGQLAMGCLTAAAVGILFPGIPGFFAPVIGFLAAFAGGACWGTIPGWLRAKTGSHEVITTIMLNFIAAGLASWVTLYLLKNPDTQNPETKSVADGFMLSPLSWLGAGMSEAHVTSALFVALGAAFVVWLFLYKTRWGFELRAVGQNEAAAKGGGVNPDRARILAMALAGGLAGLVAMNEIYGSAGKFRAGLPDYGFIGVAVALLGRCHPGGVVAAALLFGALHNGAMGLEFESEHVTQEVSMILRALVILSVSADGFWYWFRQRLPKTSPKPAPVPTVRTEEGC